MDLLPGYSIPIPKFFQSLVWSLVSRYVSFNLYKLLFTSFKYPSVVCNVPCHFCSYQCSWENAKSHRVLPKFLLTVNVQSLWEKTGRKEKVQQIGKTRYGASFGVNQLVDWKHKQAFGTGSTAKLTTNSTMKLIFTRMVMVKFQTFQIIPLDNFENRGSG